MNRKTSTSGDVAPGKSDPGQGQQKHLARKDALAESAIEALKKYGYARTSLRDIAKETGQSLGVLHYYFDSKEALLIHCIGLYQDAFMRTVLEATAAETGRAERAKALCAALASAIADQAHLHRLWYDIRGQAMFDQVFGSAVRAVEDRLIGMMAPFAEDAMAQAQLYTRLDGAFRYLLQQRLAGAALTPHDMAAFLLQAGFGTAGPAVRIS